MFGILIIIRWVLSMMGPFFFFLHYFGLFLCDALEESIGLDVSYSGVGRNWLEENGGASLWSEGISL